MINLNPPPHKVRKFKLKELERKIDLITQSPTDTVLDGGKNIVERPGRDLIAIGFLFIVRSSLWLCWREIGGLCCDLGHGRAARSRQQ